MSDSEETTPQFRIEVGALKLHAMKQLMEIEPGGVLFEVHKNEFTVAAVGRAKVIAASVTFDTDDFQAYEVEHTGEASISGKAFDGILAAVYQLQDRNSRSYELSLQGGTASLEDLENGVGGSIPLGSYVDRPTLSSFEDDLTATATVASPAAVRALHREANCEQGKGMAELAASHGAATLTMSGEEDKRADLGEATHDYDEIGIWSAEKLRDAFVAFEHVNNETTVRWGENVPVVLEMDHDDASYRAVVAPRIPGDSRDPLYKTASQVQSLDVITAGGFK